MPLLLTELVLRQVLLREMAPGLKKMLSMDPGLKQLLLTEKESQLMRMRELEPLLK